MLLPLLWVACAVAGYLYALQQNIPLATASAVLPAFLLEATFFYPLAVESARARVEKIGPVGIAAALVAAAVLPYTIATLAVGAFRWQSFVAIAALSGVAGFWYIVLPRKPAVDLLFLGFMAALMAARTFHSLYSSPIPKLQLEALGHAMWVRTGLYSMLSIRRVSGVGFGFWPKKSEWKIGAVLYLLFIVVAIEPALLIHFARPHLPTAGWEKTSLLAIATFFGVLWIVALGEEFVFRGLLQQWLSAWLRSEKVGLFLASILFGCAHLWFRKFPNWRFAIMATLAGICYGLAFQKARSIRASMVTHALVVTTWRIFFY